MMLTESKLDSAHVPVSWSAMRYVIVLRVPYNSFTEVCEQAIFIFARGRFTIIVKSDYCICHDEALFPPHMSEI